MERNLPETHDGSTVPLQTIPKKIVCVEICEQQRCTLCGMPLTVPFCGATSPAVLHNAQATNTTTPRLRPSRAGNLPRKIRCDKGVPKAARKVRADKGRKHKYKRFRKSVSKNV